MSVLFNYNHKANLNVLSTTPREGRRRKEQIEEIDNDLALKYVLPKEEDLFSQFLEWKKEVKDVVNVPEDFSKIMRKLPNLSK